MTEAVSTSTAGIASQRPAAKAATLDYDAFLRLLVAELKNQDPTKPMDTAQYIGQLASFSNVEQSIKMNAKLDQVLAAQHVSEATALIGQYIISPDGLTEGRVTSVVLNSNGNQAKLDTGGTITIGPGLTIRSP